MQTETLSCTLPYNAFSLDPVEALVLKAIYLQARPSLEKEIMEKAVILDPCVNEGQGKWLRVEP